MIFLPHRHNSIDFILYLLKLRHLLDFISFVHIRIFLTFRPLSMSNTHIYKIWITIKFLFFKG